jgi:uncharacterized phage-associated protein
MTYTPQHVANYFLDKSEQSDMPMTLLKLLKLVYIGYGWNLALTSEKLFNEKIEAWKHGPVVPSIYDEFKHFGKQLITDSSVDVDLDTGEILYPKINSADAKTDLILGKVWSVYKDFSAWTLRNKTHEIGSPWQQVYIEGRLAIVIPDEKIKEHYEERIKTYLAAAA